MTKKFFKLTFDSGEGSEWFLITARRDGLDQTKANLESEGYRRKKPDVFDRQVGGQGAQRKKIYKIESLEHFYWGA